MEESKYDIGDKILIIDNYHDSMDGSHGNSSMEQFCGKQMTITRKKQIKDSSTKDSYFYYYSMIEDNGKWSWIDSMIQRKVDSRSIGLSLPRLPSI